MPDAVPGPTLADLVAQLEAALETFDDIRGHFANDNIRPGTAAFRMAADADKGAAALRAALAESPARPLPEPPPITDDSDYFPNTDFERWHADAAESPARSREEPGLDAAEAAMPDGAKLLIGREDGGWWATSTTPRSDDKPWLDIVSTSKDGVLYPSMDEALLALADRLASRG